jgi:[protein-PII] uridylyltransferase
VDDPGLFARIAGAMALAGVNIVDAKIFTMADGMALDAFWVQDADGNAVTDAAALKRLTVTLEKVISRQRRLGARLGLKATLPSRTRVFHDQSRVLIDNKASAAYTVIEVNGRDRPGFLYDVTAALAALNLQISSAKISTYGTRAVDVFYVKDLFGLQVTHEARLGEIRARLTEAIGDADPDKPVAAEKSPAKKTRAKKNPQKKAPAKTAAAKTAAKVKPASSRKTAKKRTSAEARGGATSRTAPRRG